MIEQLQTKGLLYSQITRNTAGTVARREGISPREVPRFAIRTPDLAHEDQREVVDGLISIGPVRQVSKRHYEQIGERLSSQNLYRGTVQIRLALRWLELVELGGAPTALLVDLWQNRESATTGVDAPKPVSSESYRSSLSPAKDIYVGNLYYGASEQDLRDMFGNSGQVEHVSVPKDYLTGNNRSYAFVRMVDSATSVKAFTEINGQMLGGRPLKLGWAFRRV
jgi:ATP-dependent DNA helicase RecG